MASVDSQKIATDLYSENNGGMSQSNVRSQSASAGDYGGSDLSTQASSMLSHGINTEVSKGTQLGVSMAQYANQIAAAQASKGVLASNFAQSLGQLKNRIAQQQFESNQKQAASGFVGGSAQARQQIGLNEQIGNTLSDQEAQYLQNLRKQNVAIATGRQAELSSAQPILAGEFARQAISKKEYGMKSDEGMFGKFLGAWGKDQHMHAELDRSKFAGDTELAKLASEFNIDINSSNFQQQVGDAVKQTLTMTADSVYDRTYDVYFDSGTGPQKISEYTKSMAQTVMDDIFGGLDVAGVIAIPLTGAISIANEAIGAAAATAVEAIGTAAGESAATTVAEIMADTGIQMTASEMAGDAITSSLLDGAEQAGIQVGMDAQTMSANLSKMLSSLAGEQGLQQVSAATMKSAMEAASETFSRVAAKSGEEEALKAAALNAAQVISKDSLLTEIATAGAGEGAATSGATGAGAGMTGAQTGAESGVTGAQTGARSGWYAEQRVATPAEAATPPVPEAPVQPTVPTTPVQAPVPTGKMAQIGQKVGQVVKGTTKGVSKVGKTAVGLPIKVTWRGASTMVKSNLAQALIVPPLIAQGIYDTVMKAQKIHGLSEEAMNKMAQMLADSYKQNQEQESRPFQQSTISAKKANQTTQRLGNK